MARQIVLNLEASDPRFLTPFGVAETGLRDGRDTQEALARLHSGGSLNRSHAFAAEGGGSFAAPTGRALSADGETHQVPWARLAFRKTVLKIV